MKTNDILSTLRGERDRIDRAIEILEGIAGNHRGSGSAGPGRRKREKLSAAAKRRISAGMRASWAARKKKKIHIASN